MSTLIYILAFIGAATVASLIAVVMFGIACEVYDRVEEREDKG